MPRNRFTVEAELRATDRASAPIQKVEGRFARLGKSIKANALAITASLAGVIAAFRQIDESAKQIGQEKALERNLAAQGIAIDTYVGELKRLSDNQIATADIVLASNRALALGLKADDLPGLMTVAANAAVELGISTTQAFNDITTGIGRASPLILDNLGIVVDATKVYAAYAASIGVSVEELTKQQKTIALTDAVIKGASNAIEDFAEKQDQLTRNINRGKAAFDNLRNASGQLAGGLVQMVAGGLTATVLGFSLAAEAALKLGRAYVFVLRLLPGFDSALKGTAETLKGLDDDIDGVQQKLAKLALDLSKGGAASIQFALGVEKGTTALSKQTTALEKNREKLEENTEATEEQTQAEVNNAQETERVTRAKEAQTVAFERNTVAAQQNAQAVGAVDPSQVGTTSFQFAGGKFVFINGRRAQVFPDGTVVYP